MARLLAFGVALVGLVSVFAGGAGCTSSGSNRGAADGSVITPDAQGGAPTETAACAAAGGQCMMDDGSCTARALVDCGPSAICCVQTTTCTDANVQLIQASNYDQSCTTNSDCIAVGEGNACYVCEIECTSAAINKSAESQYKADVAKTPAAEGGALCGCPAEFGPCCRGGTCHADLQCQNPLPVADAAADTGADAATDGGGSTDADACAPSGGCTAACVAGRHNVTVMVDGCLVTECCVLDDAGGD